jgi:hypothetical protein
MKNLPEDLEAYLLPRYCGLARQKLGPIQPDPSRQPELFQPHPWLIHFGTDSTKKARASQ